MSNLEKFENYVLNGFLVLLPLLILPMFPNIYATPKIILLVVVVLVLLSIKIIKINRSGKISYTSKGMDRVVLLLALSYILSATFTNANKTEAFLLPGNASVIIFSSFLYAFVSQLNKKRLKRVSVSLFMSGVILSVIVLFASANLFEQLTFLPNYIKQASFTPLGSALQTVLYLAILVPFGIHFFLTEKGADKKILNIISLLILVFGLSVSISKIVPLKSDGSPKVVLNTLTNSWEVMFGTLRQSPLFGAGPSNYMSAYTNFKPLSTNATDLWSVRFANASNFVFTVATETGFIGLLSIILIAFLLIKIYKEKSKDTKLKKNIGWGSQFNPWYFSFGIFALFSLLFPLGIVTTIVGFILLGTLGEKGKETIVPLSVSQKDSSISNLPSLIITIPLAILVILVVFFGNNLVRAELLYKKTLDSISENNGNETYKLMQETIGLNPYSDRYRVTYSRINLALVESLLISAQEKSPDGLDEEATSGVSQLIQQAIREGKAAINLNPSRVTNWENLAQIYLTLSPFTEGSINFAVEAYTQAIRLDPMNPDLRIALGSIYYALEDYESAKDVLKLAVAVKPDHANSHFNLALAYREDGQTERAGREFEAVLELLEPENDSYEQVVELLNQLKTDIREEVEIDSPDEPKLTVPEIIEEEEPIIELEEEDSPPATEEAELAN